ncbi:hypothetical protein ABEB36_012336 [Hypothenemus hampei]|uniref:Uncharacterized protein n=1 Tax=Hypothenemus hampei TaxID=57062 RepID=A0ABD1ECV3_HYPHA
MRKSDECSAKKRAEELKTRKLLEQQNLTHQNIGGIIVSIPAVDTFPNNDRSKPLILQKSELAPQSSFPGTSFARDFQTNNQAAGHSNIDTSVPRTKDYRFFSNQPGIQETMSQTGQNKSEQNNVKFTQSGLLYTLNMIREPVVDYQEARGVPRNEEITFLSLVTSLCTQAYTAAITILVMLWNLMPLVDGFVYFVRFVLDKVIDIVQTEDNKERAIKSAILFGELTIIIFIIFLIVGLIFMPVYVLMARLFSKIFSMIAW